MDVRILSKKSGTFIFVAGITSLALVLALVITFLIIHLSGRGILSLGLLIATSCCLFIAPPISWYIFKLIRQLHQSRNSVQEANRELEKALGEVRTLKGLLPICSQCKKVRDGEGYWKQIESYIEAHSEILFSHGLCEKCLNDLYGENQWFKNRKSQSG